MKFVFYLLLKVGVVSFVLLPGTFHPLVFRVLDCRNVCSFGN